MFSSTEFRLGWTEYRAGCRASSMFFRIDSCFGFIIANGKTPLSINVQYKNGRMFRDIPEIVKKNSVVIPKQNHLIFVFNDAQISKSTSNF